MAAIFLDIMAMVGLSEKVPYIFYSQLPTVYHWEEFAKIIK